MSELSQISDNIWVGDYAHLADAVTAGCNAVVNVASTLDYVPPGGVSYRKIGMADDGTDPCNTYEAAIDAINSFIAQSKVVFINCVAGVNRGPTMVMLYLHEYWGYTWSEAQDYVEDRHTDSSPWPELLATVSLFPDERIQFVPWRIMHLRECR